MKKIVYIVVLLGGTALLLPACSTSSGSSEKKEAKAATETTKEAAYETVPVTAENLSKQLQLPGEFLSHYDVALFAKVNGFIKTLKVDVGDRVRQGQVLAVMEAPELDAELNRATADLQAAKGQLSFSTISYRRLVQAAKTPGAVAPQEVDLAHAKVMGDSANLTAKQQLVTAARQMKQYLVLTAPFNGVVTERLLSPGAFVGPNQKEGMPILKLKEVGKLRLQVTVPEVYAGQLRQHTPVSFSVDAFPGETFHGNVDRISYNVERAVRAELIEVEVSNPAMKLMPGMYANVEFPVRRQDKSLYVPTSAVVNSMEATRVIAVENGKTHYVTVKTGTETDDKVEVIGDLKPNQLVLARATEDIQDNIPIRTMPQKMTVAER